MTAHDILDRRAQATTSRSPRADQAVAASALAGGCLAVVALWKTAVNGASAGKPTR